MPQNTSLLTIDDDKFIHKLVTNSVSDDFRVITANNGKEGIQQALAEKPDIILLDVEMPEMDGYETCRQLKQNPETAEIPVMFLSSLSTEEARIKGFDAGAFDYLVKPFNLIELQSKLDALRAHQTYSKHQNEQIQQATATAYMAMRGSSELGMAIQYIENTYNANSIESLASSFFGVTKNLDLKCTLMFNLDSEHVFFYCDGKASPLEEEVISTVFERGDRFTDFDNRTQINYPRVALLVKNMPIEDREMYGRLKDFLPTMLGSTSSKIQIILNEQAITTQTKNVASCVDAIRDTLGAVGTDLEKNQSDVVNLLKSLLEEFLAKIPRLGLEEDQEAFLLERLDDTVNKAQSIIGSSKNTSQSFFTITRLLEHLSDRQHKMMESMAKSQEDDVNTEESTDGIGEVDLF
jgi:CheY-like chemotaxis protein